MQPNNQHLRAYEQDYLNWYNRAGTYAGVPFDPRPFAQLIHEQHPDRPQWAEAMLRCTRAWHREELYSYVVSPYDKDGRLHGGGFWLHHPQLGTLLVDLLDDGSIRGIEYHGRFGADRYQQPLETLLPRLARVTSSSPNVH